MSARVCLKCGAPFQHVANVWCPACIRGWQDDHAEDLDAAPTRDSDHQVDAEARADALEDAERVEREYASGERERPELALARRL